MTQVEQAPKECSACVHGALGQYGVFCTMFHEWIVDERAVAAECVEFESVKGAEDADQ